MKVQHGLLG